MNLTINYRFPENKIINNFYNMKDIKIIARFRMGIEFAAEAKWKSIEEQMCRICEKEKEELEHVTKRRQYRKRNEELLHGSGKRID